MRIRRVTFALDASPSSLGALEAAARFARTVHAELEGLFVTDEDVMRWAALPGAREVGSFSSTIRRVDSAVVERRLRSHAEHARRTMELVAERHRVRATFRVLRGRVTDRLLEALAVTDVLVIGRSGWSPAGPRRLGSTARTLAAAARGRLLLVGAAGVAPGPIGVLVDSSPEGALALELATELAQGADERLEVFCLADRPEQCAEIEATVDRQLASPHRRLRVHWLAPRLLASLGSRAQAVGTRLLLVPTGSASVPVAAFEAIVTDFADAILTVGRAEPE